MPKPVLWIVGALVALALVGFGGHWYAGRLMSQRALTPRALGNKTPASEQLPFVRVAIPSGDRTLIGWWVKAPPTGAVPAPAVLFFHGNSSSISDYVTLQKFFYRQGVSTFVFDYSGFGASGGSASLKDAVEDAANAAKMFADTAGRAARKVAMGSALGATVLLQAIDSVQPHVAGVVIEGVDASVNEAALASGRVPKFLAPMLREVGDNVAAAANVRVPVLAVHSMGDARAPMEGAQRVMAAVTTKSSLVKHWRKGHSAILASSKACDWAPVLAFVKNGTLPAAKVDSTNVCEVERLAAAAAKAQAAAIAAAQAKNASKSKTKSVPTKTRTPATKAPASTKTVAPAAKKP